MTKKSSARLLKDANPPRDKEVISKEYGEVCAMAGDKQYRIEILKNELVQLNNKLFELNQEAAAKTQLMAEAAAATAVKTPPAAPAPVTEEAEVATKETPGEQTFV